MRGVQPAAGGAEGDHHGDHRDGDQVRPGPQDHHGPVLQAHAGTRYSASRRTNGDAHLVLLLGAKVKTITAVLFVQHWKGCRIDR